MSERELKRQKSVLEDDKFYRTTDIGGFGHISSSNVRPEATIWYLVIVVFTVITAVSVYNLTVTYLSKPTKTTVSIENFDNSYRLKTMKMDLKLGVPGFSPEYFESYFTRPPGIEEPITNDTAMEEVEAAIEVLNTAEKLKGYWPHYGLLPLFAIFTATISRCEQDGECRPPFPSLHEPTIQFIKHAEGLGIDQHELIQIFGRQLLNRCQLPWIGDWWFTGIDAHLDTEEYSHAKGHVYSFRLITVDGIESDPHTGNHYYFGFEMDVYKFAKGYIKDIYATEEYGAAITWYNDNYKPYLQLSYIGDDEKEILVAKPGHLVTAGMLITASYHILPKKNDGRPSCSNPNETMFQCKYASVNEFDVTVNCNCAMTFTYGSPFVNNISEFCGYEQYSEGCGIFEHYGDSLMFDKYGTPQYCKTIKCHMDFVQIYHIKTQYLGWQQDCCSKIQIRLLESEYPLFVEELEQTFTDYLANLGGAMDLWIGASIIGVIHVLVYMTKQIIYAFRRNTKTGRNVRRAVDNWRNKEPMGQMMASLTMGLVTTAKDKTTEERLRILEEQMKKIIEENGI